MAAFEETQEEREWVERPDVTVDISNRVKRLIGEEVKRGPIVSRSRWCSQILHYQRQFEPTAGQSLVEMASGSGPLGQIYSDMASSVASTIVRNKAWRTIYNLVVYQEGRDKSKLPRLLVTWKVLVEPKDDVGMRACLSSVKSQLKARLRSAIKEYKRMGCDGGSSVSQAELERRRREVDSWLSITTRKPVRIVAPPQHCLESSERIKRINDEIRDVEDEIRSFGGTLTPEKSYTIVIGGRTRR